MSSNTLTRRATATAVAISGAVAVGFAGAPSANASVHADYWWGQSTWYSKSEVRRLAPDFRLLTDKTSQAGGVGYGAACGAFAIPLPLVGLGCGAMVAGGIGYMQVQASDFDYAAAKGMCVEVVEPNVGLYDVKAYSCDWQ